MNSKKRNHLSEILKKYEHDILTKWMHEQKAASSLRLDILSEKELQQQSTEFLNLFAEAVRGDNLLDIEAANYAMVRHFLANLSKTRAIQGFSPSETTTFIFSLKQPLFSYLENSLSANPQNLLKEIWAITSLIDKLGLYTVEEYLKTREEIINRQQLE